MKGFILRSLLFIIVVAVGATIGGYLALVRAVPQIDEIKGFMPANGTKVYADDDTLIGEFRIEKGEYTPGSMNMHTYQDVTVEDLPLYMHARHIYPAFEKMLKEH